MTSVSSAAAEQSDDGGEAGGLIGDPRAEQSRREPSVHGVRVTLDGVVRSRQAAGESLGCGWRDKRRRTASATMKK